MSASETSGNVYSLEDLPYSASRGGIFPSWWLNALLFVVTFLTSTAFGSAVARCFEQGRPLGLDVVVDAYLRLIYLDREIWSGLAFSIPLLSILLAHEFGHYFVCRSRNVAASLPYFLPSPSLFGTFGAFIRIRSPIYSREGLFDIGIGGPIAGFVVLLPFLIAGVIMSKVVSRFGVADPVLLGTPLILRLLEQMRFPGILPDHIILHPMAMAAWAGLFATALNLLPIGQLDGGHIIYALGSDHWHKRVSLTFVLLLAVAGFFYWPWWFWGVAMFFFGRRHPLVYDTTPLSRRRILLWVAAILIFLLSVTVIPVRSL